MFRVTDDLQGALRHEAALRRLAAVLGAAGDTDDAVQHALVQAATGRRPAGSPLLPFLRTVLRRHVLNGQKLAVRRRQREAACAVGAPVPPPHEIVAREQLRRRVADAVLALDEPYRTAVWLRWFEDLTVAAIAQRTNAPEATVRTRLLRAHAQLRARLDRDYGDRQWTVLATPLGATAPLPAAAAGIFGGLLVNKLVAGTAGVLIAAGIVWWWLQPPPPIAHTSGSSSPPAAQQAAAAPQVERVPLAADERTDAAPATPVPADAAKPIGDPTEAQLEAVAGTAEPGCIEGIVLDGRGPLGGGRAWLRGTRDGPPPWAEPADWDQAPGVQRTAIDALGRFVFTHLAPDTYAIGIRTEAGVSRHVWVELHDLGTRVSRVRIPVGNASIRGHVFDPDGLPGAEWYVGLYNVGRSLGGTQGINAVRADARGAFTIGGLCAGSYRIAATPVADLRDPRQRAVTVEIAAGEAADVNVGEPLASCDWRGRVLLPAGGVLVALMKTEVELTRGQARVAYDVSPQGEFQCRAAPGTHAVHVYFANGVRVPLGSVHVPERAWSHDVVLPQPVLRVRPTFVATATPQHPRTPVRARLQLSNGTGIESVQATDGCAYFFGVPPGQHRLQCWSHAIAGAPPGGIAVTVPAMPEVDLDVTLSER